MIFLLILGVLAALTAGLLCLPLSLHLQYLDGKLSLKAAVWFVTVFRYPKKQKRVRLRRYTPRAVRRRREKEKKKAAQKAAAAAQKKTGTAGKKKKTAGKRSTEKKKGTEKMLLRYLAAALASGKKLKKVLRADVRTLVFTVASGDPDKTARLYGAASGPFLILREHLLSGGNIRLHPDTHVALLADFSASKPDIECDLKISVTVAGLLSLLVAAPKASSGT